MKGKSLLRQVVLAVANVATIGLVSAQETITLTNTPQNHIPAPDLTINAPQLALTQPQAFTATITGAPALVLPIHLKAFDARHTDGITQLQWQSIDEYTLTSYELERSTDGINFYTIATVAADGNGGYYHYQDRDALNGNVFYRLKMNFRIDPIAYSQVVKVNAVHLRETLVYPSVVTDAVLHITTPADVAQVSIYSLQGRLMQSAVIDARNEAPAHTLQLSVPAGSYIVTVANLANGQLLSQSRLLVP